jgi:hypothetical protein
LFGHELSSIREYDVQPGMNRERRIRISQSEIPPQYQVFNLG